MSEITDLTKAVKELTSQLKNQGGGGGGGPRPSLDDVVKERQVREEMYKLDVEAAKTSRERQELKRSKPRHLKALKPSREILTKAQPRLIRWATPFLRSTAAQRLSPSTSR